MKYFAVSLLALAVVGNVSANDQAAPKADKASAPADIKSLSAAEKEALLNQLLAEKLAEKQKTAVKKAVSEPAKPAEIKAKAKAEPKKQKAVLSPGWILKVQKFKDLNTQGDEIGVIKAESDKPIHLQYHLEDADLKWFKDTAAYRFEGYLKVNEPGQHTFIANITLPENDKIYSGSYPRFYSQCSYTLEVEDLVLINQKTEKNIQETKTISLTAPTDLDKGLYRVVQWWACQGFRPRDRYQRTTANGQLDMNPYDEFELNLLLKTPKKNPKPIQVYYKKQG